MDLEGILGEDISAESSAMDITLGRSLHVNAFTFNLALRQSKACACQKQEAYVEMSCDLIVKNDLVVTLRCIELHDQLCGAHAYNIYPSLVARKISSRVARSIIFCRGQCIPHCGTRQQCPHDPLRQPSALQ